MLEENLVICIKISQKKWIDNLRAGAAWFGEINNYIVQAETSNNNEQGDKYEGVFSRCKKDSHLIAEFQHRLGDDLEVIDDGEYCFLISLMLLAAAVSLTIFILNGAPEQKGGAKK